MKNILLATLFILSVHTLFAQEPDTPLTAIDTLDTEDKFVKIVLYDNKTWDYMDMGRPVIDETAIYEDWAETIHAYRDVKLADLPDEIDICLADSLHGWSYPILPEKVNSKYMVRRGREHNGIDLPLKIGDSVKVAFDGVVRKVAYDRGGYGNVIVVRHPNGLESYYGHLSKTIAKENEIVKAGEVIGLGGSTGRSTGPHLHFEVRCQGQSFDPERLFDFTSGQLRDSIIVLKKHYFSIYSHYGQTDEESKAAAGRIVHVIKSGDTLGGLAKRYGTTVSKICQLNGISSKKILRIGERIIVR